MHSNFAGLFTRLFDFAENTPMSLLYLSLLELIESILRHDYIVSISVIFALGFPYTCIWLILHPKTGMNDPMFVLDCMATVL